MSQIVTLNEAAKLKGCSSNTMHNYEKFNPLTFPKPVATVYRSCMPYKGYAVNELDAFFENYQMSEIISLGQYSKARKISYKALRERSKDINFPSECFKRELKTCLLNQGHSVVSYYLCIELDAYCAENNIAKVAQKNTDMLTLLQYATLRAVPFNALKERKQSDDAFPVYAMTSGSHLLYAIEHLDAYLAQNPLIASYGFNEMAQAFIRKQPITLGAHHDY